MTRSNWYCWVWEPYFIAWRWTGDQCVYFIDIIGRNGRSVVMHSVVSKENSFEGIKSLCHDGWFNELLPILGDSSDVESS